MDPSIYSPLSSGDAFRVVTLHAGTADAEVRLSLVPAELGSQVEYEALSYVWGPPNFSESISCHGVACKVTPNLLAALRRLRYSNKDRTLWVDAICIRQSDIDERIQQVSRMRDIYSQASRVLVWLGDEDEALASSAHHLAGLLLAAVRDNPDLPSAGPQARVIARNMLVAHPWFVEHFNPATSLLRNEWFQRVWTFQEAYLAQEAELICGSVSFPLEPFVSTWGLMGQLGIRPPLSGNECAMTLFATCSWKFMTRVPGQPEPLPPGTGLRLSNLLRSTYMNRATDPRDRVFGLLAMVETRNGLRYVPDYRMPTEEVYTKVARLLIEDDGHLQILSDAQGLKHNPELPSWVPDWRGESLVKPLAERTRTFTQTYRIHGNFEPSEIITPHSDDRMLKLHGAALGKIKLLIALDELRAALCSQDIQLDNWSRLLSLPRQFFEMCNAVGLSGPSTYGPTNEPKSIAFIKTLAADRLPCSSRLTPSDVEEFFPWYSDYDSLTWREALRPLALPTSAMDDSSHADVAGGPSREVIGVLLGTAQPTRWNFGSSNILEKLKVATVYRNIADDVINAVISKLSQRAMLVTDTGYMGIGPANATTGDEVYDLMGGDVPFVLRPTSGENEFGLLGDCYVHGVMDGQLWRPNADGTWLESVDGSLEWRAVTLI